MPIRQHRHEIGSVTRLAPPRRRLVGLGAMAAAATLLGLMSGRTSAAPATQVWETAEYSTFLRCHATSDARMILVGHVGGRPCLFQLGVDGELEREMLIVADDPTVSVRITDMAADDEGGLLLVGYCVVSGSSRTPTMPDVPILRGCDLSSLKDAS